MRWCIMPGLPTYLVQEINVGTIPLVKEIRETTLSLGSALIA